MILEQIKNPDFFNNSEQNMIYFLQNNLNSFDQVTLNKMAKESFSSTSSVLRFCKKLGFDGFKDFKLQLIRETSISGQDLNFNLPFLQMILLKISVFIYLKFLQMELKKHGIC